MNNIQIMIDEINGIINCLPEEDKAKLPDELKKYFNENASAFPTKVIDKNKKLEEQCISDETLLMLSYINNLLNKK